MNIFLRFLITVTMICALAVFISSCNNSDNIEKADAISPTLIENITAGMSYQEVTDVLGTTGTDVGSGAIIFEYQLSDGRVAYIWFQSNGGAIEDMLVSSIEVK